MDLLKAEQLEQLPANWSFGVLYWSKTDPRWIVPMRFTNAGWTPNLAHSRAVLLAIALLAAGITPFGVALATGSLRDPKIALATILCLIAFLVPPGVLARYRAD